MIQKNMFLLEPPRKLFPYCYCVFIDDAARVVIDTSCSKEQAGALNGHGIDIIVNTHYHYDHSRNNHLFPQSQVWIHTSDAPFLQSMEKYADGYGFQTPAEKHLAKDFFPLVTFRPSAVHRELNDGEILDFGKVKLQVIHTPGHSPGHCCFYQEKTGLLISGDIDLSRFGPWYAHDNCNLDELIMAIKRCMEIDPQQMVTGHTGIIEENLQKRLQDFMQVLYTKEEIIYETLRIPQTLEHLAEKRLYSQGGQGMSDDIDWFHEKIGIKKHLEKLLRENRIKQEGALYYQT